MADVSRETPASAPLPDRDVALRVFESERLPALQEYAELLATEGVLRGLIGPRETPRLWDRHLLNCGLLTSVVPPDAEVADLGSGAGLPGLVLALARPDLRLTLVEPLLRRTTFLDEAVRRLGLANVEVVRGRAEELAGRRSFDVVTSRALAPLPRLLGWSLPLVRAEGAVLAMKGAGAAAEVGEVNRLLDQWGARAEVLELAVEGASSTTVVRVAGAGSAGIGWQATSVERRRSRRRGRT